MRKQLKDIAEIRSGHTFRGKIEETPTGNFRVMQIKDLRGKREIRPHTLPFIQSGNLNKSNLVQEDDVVMPARGEHYNAAVFKSDRTLNEPIIATNQIFILRLDKNNILPGYLCWYLNQSETSNYLKSEIRGSNIPFISKQSLSRLKLPIPPIEIQSKIVALVELQEKERQLTEQLMQNRETMLKGMFQQLLEQ